MVFSSLFYELKITNWKTEIILTYAYIKELFKIHVY